MDRVSQDCRSTRSTLHGLFGWLDFTVEGPLIPPVALPMAGYHARSHAVLMAMAAVASGA